jgi:lipopolysaccharide heptosyltransferase II
MTWDEARRLLCVRLDTIGDVLMTGPAIRALREAAPGRSVTLLTSPAGAATAELMPEVDEAIAYEAPWMKPAESRPPDPDADVALVDALRERRFDAAAIFTVYSQSPLPAALLCHLAGIPLAVAHSRERAYGLLSDEVRETEPHEQTRHEVRRQLDLVAAVGARPTDERLLIEIPEAARAQASELLAAAGVESARPWVALHPGSTAPSRRYPVERWAAVARELQREHGIQVVTTGDASDAELAAQVGAPSLAGRLDLPGLAALLEAAPLLLAGNTGPVHVAAAAGTPVVDVYALTNPQHTPWGVPSRVLSHDVPCRWCYGSVCREGHHLCLRGVEPGEVVAAALELLATSPAGPRTRARRSPP